MKQTNDIMTVVERDAKDTAAAELAERLGMISVFRELGQRAEKATAMVQEFADDRNIDGLDADWIAKELGIDRLVTAVKRWSDAKEKAAHAELIAGRCRRLAGKTCPVCKGGTFYTDPDGSEFCEACVPLSQPLVRVGQGEYERVY